MNKVILSALVLLLVAQGIHFQLIPTINLSGSLVTNLVTYPLALTSSYIETALFNVLSFVTFYLRWPYSQTAFLTYVPPKVTIGVSTNSLANFQTVSPPLRVLLSSILQKANSVNANVALFYAALNNRPYTNCGRTAASLAINTYQESTLRVSYSFARMASVMSGRRPNPSPFTISQFDPSYPAPSLQLPTDTDGFRAQVGVQANNLILFSQYFVRDVQAAADNFQNTRGQIRGGCICPTSSSVSLILSQLSSINSILSSFTSSTVTSRTLLQSLSTTAIANLNAAFAGVNLYLGLFQSCTQCLVTSLQNNGSRCIKAYCNSVPINDSISAGFNDTSCIASGRRAIARFSNNVIIDYNLARSQELKAQGYLFSRVFTYIGSTLTFVNQGVVKVGTNIGYLRKSKFKTKMGVFKNSLETFSNNLATSFNALIQNVNTKLNSFNNIIDTTISSSSSSISSSVLSFAQTVVDGDTLYPCCQQYSGLALDIQDKFQSDIKTCMQNADTAVASIAKTLTSSMTTFGKNFNRYTKTVDQCLNSYCLRWIGCNAFLLFPTFDNHVTSCVIAVITAMDSANPAILTTGSTNMGFVTSTIATANATFYQCINTAVTNAQQSLQTIKSQYETCKRVGTCTNGTTDMRPTLATTIEQVLANLTAILSHSGSTTIDAKCRDAVMADARFLVNQAVALNNSLMTQSYSTEVTYLNTIIASVNAVAYNLTLCPPDNRTIFLQNVTESIAGLSALWNATTNVTNVNPDCLNATQTNLTAFMDIALALQANLSYIEYEINVDVLTNLPNIIAEIQAEWQACLAMPYDNRTSLIPNLNQSLTDLNSLKNTSSDPTLNPACALPLQANITVLLNAAEQFQTMVLNLPYETVQRVVTEIQTVVIRMQAAAAACQAFDNRTLLIPGVDKIGNDVTNLLNSISTSGSNAPCLTEILANITLVSNSLQELNSTLFNNTYQTNADIIYELQLSLLSLQVAFNTCMTYDNRSEIASNVTGTLAALTNLTSTLNSSGLNPACAGPLLVNLTLLIDLSTYLQIDIFNYSYDVGVVILAELQFFLIQAQAAYTACVNFDNRTLLQQNFTSDQNSLNNLANQIMSSTADQSCLVPIQEELNILLNASVAISASIFSQPYEAGFAAIQNFEVSIAQLQVAYNACLGYDNRTTLVNNITTTLDTLISISNTLSSSGIEPSCAGPLLQNLTLLINASEALKVDIFNYPYDIGQTILIGLQDAIAQAQAAFAACLNFDNRTLLQSELTTDQVNLNSFMATLMSSTADPSCLVAIQQNVTLLAAAANILTSKLFNQSYADNLRAMINFDSVLAELQAAYNACLLFDNRTNILTNISTTLTDLTNLANALNSSGANPACAGPLLVNLTLLIDLSVTFKVDVFNYSYDIGVTILAEIQIALVEAQTAYTACLNFDNRTLLQQNFTSDQNILNNLANQIMSSTADQSCLVLIQEELSVLLNASAAISVSLFNQPYEAGFVAIQNLEVSIAQLQVAYNACLAYDNRTSLLPTIHNILANASALNNLTSVSTANAVCLIPIQQNLTLLIDALIALDTYIFSYPYEIGLIIINSLQDAINQAQAAYEACLNFDNRTLLQPELAVDIANLTAIANLIMSSTASPYCLGPIQQHLASVLSTATDISNNLMNNPYDTSLASMNSLDAAVLQLLIDFNACLNFDNRTLLVPVTNQIAVNVSALNNIVSSSTANPYCLGPIQQNLTILINASIAIQVDIFNYPYDIAQMILNGIQDAIAQLQAAFTACLSFDNRTLLQSELAADQSNISALANIIMSSSADPYCLSPIQQNMTIILAAYADLSANLMNNSYDANLIAMAKLEASFAELAAVYNSCLYFDNRTLLVPDVHALTLNLTDLNGILNSSSADPHCLVPLQQNISILVNVSASLEADIFSYTYDIGYTILTTVKDALAQAQAAYDACLNFDNRTLLIPILNNDLASLTSLANIIMNSTADPYCLVAIQQNVSTILTGTTDLSTFLLSIPYETGLLVIASLESAIAEAQTAYAACLLFDNRTLLVPNITDSSSIIANLTAQIANTTGDPACFAPLLENLAILTNVSQSLQAELFNYTYDIGAAILDELQNSIAQIQAGLTACQADNRTALIPPIANVVNDLTTLKNALDVSNASSFCAGPLQQNLTLLINASASVQNEIYNYPYEILEAILTGLQDAIVQLQTAFTDCLNFDNRTLLQPELTTDQSNLAAFATLIMSSTADPSCLVPIQQNLSLLATAADVLASNLFNQSYTEALVAMMNFDTALAQLEAAYNVCLAYDNRTNLLSSIDVTIANLTALNQTATDPTCSGPLLANLTLLMDTATALKADLFNYSYDIGQAILSGLKDAIIQAQAAYLACLNFDNRTLLQQNVTTDQNILNDLANQIMSSTADQSCLDPIKENLNSVQNVANIISSSLFNSSYQETVLALQALENSISQLQVAFVTCQNYDNRTSLLPNITNSFDAATALNNLLASSTADPSCLGPLQQNVSILVNASAELQIDLFSYQYDIAQIMLISLQQSIVEAQAAFVACQSYDNRTTLVPQVIDKLAALQTLANQINSSTANPSCLVPIQQNLSIIQEATAQLPGSLFNYTYEVDLSIISDLQQSINDLQSQFNACLVYDNRTELVPATSAAVTSLTNLMSQAATVTSADPNCLPNLLQNLTILLASSESLKTEIFNYTYDIGQLMLSNLQQAIQEAQAQLTGCINYDPRVTFYDFSAAALANLTNIANDLANIPASSSCLQPIQQAIAVLNQTVITFNQNVMINDYNTDAQNAANITQALSDLKNAETACKNSQFYTSNDNLFSNASDLVNKIAESSAYAECVTPILQNIAWLFGNITAFNTTIPSDTYSNELATSNSLYATYAAIQSQWSACLAFTTTTTSSSTTTTTSTTTSTTTTLPTATQPPTTQSSTTQTTTQATSTTKTYPATTMANQCGYCTTLTTITDLLTLLINFSSITCVCPPGFNLITNFIDTIIGSSHYCCF